MKYQFNYAKSCPQMYDSLTREQKARRIIKLLQEYYHSNNLKHLKVLDIGSSTGIIDNILADHFKFVVGVDIDNEAILFARKHFKKNNLKFRIGNAMNLNSPASSFNVVICTHVYEHVPRPIRLFSEIYRMLKPGGICYFAAVNKLWIIEPHYKLPFLSILPKQIANLYLKLFGKGNIYYETLMTFWGLKKLVKQFKVLDYTQKILQNPDIFGFGNVLPPNSLKTHLINFFAPIIKFFTPTLFWILVKETRNSSKI